MIDKKKIQVPIALMGALLLTVCAKSFAYESLIVVDANISAPESLFEAVPENTHFIQLNATDTLEMVGAKLSKYKNIHTLSLYSHGRSGEVKLAGETISTQSVEEYLTFTKMLTHTLSSDGELRLYGCEIAKASKGKSFVDGLASSIERSVAASDDLTGSGQRGGDWDLEYIVGNSSKLLIDSLHSEQYAYLLAPALGETIFSSVDVGVEQDSKLQGASQDYIFTTLGDNSHYIEFTGGAIYMTANNIIHFEIASNDGSEFKLDSFRYEVSNMTNTTMRIQGRKDGTDVTAAVKEITTTTELYTPTILNFDDVVAFADIDEVWITFPGRSEEFKTLAIASISISAAPTDETPPVIQNAVIANSAHKVGDTVPVTITVDSDPDDYSTGSGAISGTVNGYTLSGLSKVNDTTYSSSIVIADEGIDRAVAEDIPVSVVLTDSRGNESLEYTNEISQDSDAIYANQPHLSLTASPSALAESGGSSTVTANLTDTLNNTWPDNIVVNLSYSGTATVTSDYTKSDAITIVAGQSSGTTTISAVTDSVYDAAQNETVTVQINSASMTSDIDSQVHTVIITDAQSAPTVTFTGTTQSISENAGSVSVGVQLSHATYEDVTVTLSYSGTALSGTDYESPSLSIIIPAGNTSANAVQGIVGVDDSNEEGSESVIINIASASGGGATENGTQLLQYTLTDDDDETPPTFSSTPTLTAVSAVGATLNVSLNEDGNVYYAVVSDGDSAPISSEIKAGQVGSLASAHAVGTILTSSLSGSDVIAGLADGTDYDVYIVAEDLLANLQTTPVALNLATVDISPNVSAITLSGSPTANATSLTFVVTFEDSVSNISTDDFIARLNGNVVTGLSVNSVSSAQGSSVTVMVSANQVDGVVRLDLKGSTNIVDESGTSPNAYVSGATHTLDTIAPTVTSILRQTPASEVTASDSLIWRVTFSESLGNIDVSDFAVSGTTAVASQVSSASASVVDVTVSGGDLASADGSVSLSIAGGNNLLDDSGNSLLSVIPTTSQTYLLDNTAPSLVLASASPALKASETASVTFSLTETSNDFSLSDITVEGGSLSNFSGSGSSYTATFTPSENQMITAKVKVAGNVFSDGAGNGNTAASDVQFSVDTQAPSVTLSSSLPTLDESETATITFNLSETSGDFGQSSMNVTGGQISAFSGSGTTYTATVTANSTDYEGITINIPANRFSDSAGNPNTSVSLLIGQTTTNQAPTISGSPALTVDQGATYSFVPTASDADDNPISFSILNKPDWAAFDSTTGALSGTPDQEHIGVYSNVVITVSDGEETTDLVGFDIIVNDVNDQPVALDDTYILTDGIGQTHSLDVLINDSDIDEDTLSIAWVSSLGQVSYSDDRIQLTASQVGTVVIQYGISDGKGGEAMAKATVTFESTASELPTISAPPDLIANATGLYTRLKLGTATAFDKSGLALSVSLSDKNMNFPPGINMVNWITKDVNGNTAVDVQTVTVYPLVSIQKDVQTAEGTSHKVLVLLNGESPVYPLTVPYTVSGTASSADHTLQSGEITIISGTEASIEFEVHSDALVEGTETLIIELSNSLNLSSKHQFVLTIEEENIAPSVAIKTILDEEQVSRLSKSADAVSVVAEINDPNPEDTHTYTWSTSNDDLAVLISSQTTQSSLSFTTATLPYGIYLLNLEVEDNGSPSLTVTVQTYLEVVETLATLTNEDSDGDLIPDSQEGHGDSDNDGIPNYLDANLACNVVPQDVTQNDQFLLEGQPGVCLRKGVSVLGNQSGAARLFKDELSTDSVATNIGGIFDFIAMGLPTVGQSFQIVIPQRLPIPADAVYRKHRNGQGWSTFVIDSNNSVASTMGELGYCPPPGDPVWVDGLTEGHWCVQVTIEDGGPNDEDDTANGNIVDPSGVAVVGVGNTLPVANDDSVIVGKNSNATINVLTNDTDSDGQALSISSAVADFGGVEISEDTLSYTAATDFLGEDAITYSVTDSHGGTDTASVTVTVVNSFAPLASNDRYETDDRTPIIINVLSNDSDPDGDAISLRSATTAQGKISLNADNTLTYTPKIGFEGNDTVTYVISDTHGLQDSGRVNVTVNLAYDADVVNTSGGGGINGLWAIMLGLVALYRRVKSKRWVLLVWAVSTTAQANWFVEGQLGISHAHDRKNLISETEYATDDRGRFYSIALGYTFNSDWAVSISYLDMGEASTTLASTTTTPIDYHSDVASISPLLVEGVGIDAGYTFWRKEKWQAEAKVGILRWKTDVKSQYQGSNLYTSFDGTDPYMGAKFGFNATSQLDLSLNFSRYFIEENDVDVGTLVFRYKWSG
ncbi:Ig-like domain-containing protein [Enterovibrio calviensis]|uniref:Ig-like domain-containing protein n=1 Tax=Enterovibrio calviensis TaxID=91359 RepID=UPI003735F840